MATIRATRKRKCKVKPKTPKGLDGAAATSRKKEKSYKTMESEVQHGAEVNDLEEEPKSRQKRGNIYNARPFTRILTLSVSDGLALMPPLFSNLDKREKRRLENNLLPGWPVSLTIPGSKEDQVTIKLCTNKLRTFQLDGTVCRYCGMSASFFAVEQECSNMAAQPVMNLYGIDEATKQEVAFTSDHIIPRARGGKDGLSNRQTLCIVCNSCKGSLDSKSSIEYTSIMMEAREARIVAALEEIKKFQERRKELWNKNHRELLLALRAMNAEEELCISLEAEKSVSLKIQKEVEEVKTNATNRKSRAIHPGQGSGEGRRRGRLFR